MKLTNSITIFQTIAPLTFALLLSSCAQPLAQYAPPQLHDETRVFGHSTSREPGSIATGLHQNVARPLEDRQGVQSFSVSTPTEHWGRTRELYAPTDPDERAKIDVAVTPMISVNGTWSQ